jgi:hypothetical protein
MLGRSGETRFWRSFCTALCATIGIAVPVPSLPVLPVRPSLCPPLRQYSGYSLSLISISMAFSSSAPLPHDIHLQPTLPQELPSSQSTFDQQISKKQRGSIKTAAAEKACNDYPWIVAMAESCYSDRQVASGKDLTQTKKKYKQMFCLYCAEFNPATPWAHMKARKFEKDNFAEHEKSSHHLKALAARKHSSESLIPTTSSMENSLAFNPELSALYNNSSSSSAIYALSILPKSTAPNHWTSPHDSISSVSTTSSQLHLLVPESNPVELPSITLPSLPSTKDLQIPNMQLDFIPPIPPELIDRSQTTFLDNLCDAALRPRARFVPNWLRAVGKLNFSQRQLTSGKNLNSTKKKYKNIMCSLCAEFCPDSPWSKLKPRKFETAVLLEHENSFSHKKALEDKQKRDTIISNSANLNNCISNSIPAPPLISISNIPPFPVSI